MAHAALTHTRATGERNIEYAVKLGADVAVLVVYYSRRRLGVQLRCWDDSRVGARGQKQVHVAQQLEDDSED